MTENVAELGIGIGIERIFVVAAKQIEKVPHIVVVHEGSALIGAEKLAKVEDFVLIDEVGQ